MLGRELFDVVFMFRVGAVISKTQTQLESHPLNDLQRDWLEVMAWIDLPRTVENLSE